ncbi:Cyclophilin-like peptidyl-prolyl cis-trans isomerase family protein [Heracleum sosnowskyi]|uniref:Cyclophilin-like peptidyl-prolyl cis-trans isomerase family protein n=1 Tax=Heracleum sosnowskyi TaxID=360622 RepID=A0AAD8N6J2_9APIA|nr:Cyclophilin-like peptidyl-prolyl cis-trans isomerase family protein [Heracleum sosnowskyi]
MDAAAGHMMLQCPFDSSLSMSDMDIERRPYHRNCSCALHKQKDERPTSCFKHGNVAFAKKHSWSDCSISTTAPKSALQSPFLCNLAGKTKEKDGLLFIRNKGTDGIVSSR